MSSFNAESFLSTRSQGKMDTKYPTCPAGWYQAQIDNLAARQVDKNDGSGQSTVMDINWLVLDDNVKQQLNVERVLVRQGIFLDLTEEGQLDYGTGKNVKLGKVRDVLKQNNPKKDWFPNLLIGSMARIHVEHKPNPNDPDSPYANVTEIAPL